MSTECSQSEIELPENYDKAFQHWTSVSSDVNSMLGGFEKLHSPDISGSRSFLLSLKNSVNIIYFYLF